MLRFITDEILIQFCCAKFEIRQLQVLTWIWPAMSPIINDPEMSHMTTANFADSNIFQ